MTLARRTLYIAEPRPRFLARPPLVADCSVLAALLFAEPAREQAFELLAGHMLHAPFLIDCEFASIALKKRAAGWPSDVVDAALEDYAAQQLELHRPELRRLYELAVKYHITAYDAAYLSVAADLRAPLATFDRQLGDAARQHLGAIE